MKQLLSIVVVGTGLCLVETAYAHTESIGQARATPVTSQSKSESASERQRHEEQARQSQETPSHSQFGGAPKDQDTRERHHPQYPESAQHLGPQEEEGQTSKGTAGSGKTRPGHEEKKKDAVSGVGR